MALTTAHIAFIIVAIIVGVFCERHIFRRSTPFAALPALWVGFMSFESWNYLESLGLGPIYLVLILSLFILLGFVIWTWIDRQGFSIRDIERWDPWRQNRDPPQYRNQNQGNQNQTRNDPGRGRPIPRNPRR